MPRSSSSLPRVPRRPPRSVAVVAAGVTLVALASTAAAHDYWLIPDMFAFPGDATVHVIGRQGTRFPAGRAIAPAQVADVGVVGAAGATKITDMAVEGTALRLHHKPSAAGQYLIAARFASRTLRMPPAGVIRFLRAEGGAAEAARLERENVLAGLDTVVFTNTSYAATIAQVGAGGPRAFSKTAGFPLEFVPVNDPAHLHVGDTLHVTVLGRGKPVPHIGIDATPAADTTTTVTPAPRLPWVTLTADANGVVHVPLTEAGPWMLRSAHLSRKEGGATNEWDVSRTTYVLNVGAAR